VLPTGFIAALGGPRLMSTFTSVGGVVRPAACEEAAKRVLVMTDPGTDVDDVWALAGLVALQQQGKLRIEAVITSTYDTVGRAKIVCKFLESVGAGNVPVCVGKETNRNEKYLAGGYEAGFPWAANYELSRYPGGISEDHYKLIAELAGDPSNPIDVLVLAPPVELSDALYRNPTLARGMRVTAMSGSFRRGYGGSTEQTAEFNVVGQAGEMVPFSAVMYRVHFAADLCVTPLDTSGTFVLDGPSYEALLQARREGSNVLVETVLQIFEDWVAQKPFNGAFGSVDPEVRSGVVFDAVAVGLLMSEQWFHMTRSSVDVTPKGYTQLVHEFVDGEDEATVLAEANGSESAPVRLALEWVEGGTEAFAEWYSKLLLDFHSDVTSATLQETPQT